MRKLLVATTALFALMACGDETTTSTDVQETVALPPADMAEEVCEYCPDMAVIQPASFDMGEWKDRGYGMVEGPRHTVTFPKAFEVAKYEVSLAQFQVFTEDSGYVSEKKCMIYTDAESWHVSETRNWQNPGFPQEPEHPVVCVSWEDTQAYISWLKDKTGKTYRLTSEAEWEYLAAFGGIEEESGYVTHNVANIGKAECCGGKVEGTDQWLYTAPIGSFPSDVFGIHDMRGNAWEWQADCYRDSYEGSPADGGIREGCENTVERIVRGGGYADGGEYMDPHFRLPGKLANGYFTVGFRLVREID